MKNRHKVIWAEGILLGQQHFQCWDNYHAHTQHFLWQTLALFAVGIKRLEFDETSLSIGQIIIKRCDAIFPHGLIIDYDDRIDSPLALQLQQPQQIQHSTPGIIDIYLAVPITSSVKNISGYPEKVTQPGWLGDYQRMSDEYDTQREREVLLARPNLQLLSSQQDRSLFYCLKILEIIQKGHGEFRAIDAFVPRIICLSASPWLLAMLRSHNELLAAKIHLLQLRRQEYRIDNPVFDHSDLIDFLLLQLFNQTLPALQFLLQYPETPPHQFYLALSCFISGLSTFDISPTHLALPVYSPEDLRGTFTVLDQQLKKLLDAVMPSKMATLRLKRESDTTYLVSNIDTIMLSKNSFYLAVAYEASQQDQNQNWQEQFMRQVKLAAYSQLASIIAAALPGVKITHMQRLPNKLPVKAGYEYFYLEPSGDSWAQIKTERTMGLFTPYLFSRAKIELVAVQL